MKAALNFLIVVPPDRMDFRRHAAAAVATWSTNSFVMWLIELSGAQVAARHEELGTSP
jgi:hypothetical protein